MPVVTRWGSALGKMEVDTLQLVQISLLVSAIELEGGTNWMMNAIATHERRDFILESF